MGLNPQSCDLMEAGTIRDTTASASGVIGIPREARVIAPGSDVCVCVFYKVVTRLSALVF